MIIQWNYKNIFAHATVCHWKKYYHNALWYPHNAQYVWLCWFLILEGDLCGSSIWLCRSFPSWVLIDPPRINIVSGNSCNVFMDPFQVECQSTPPRSTLSDVILAMCLQVLSKFVDPFQVECRLNPPGSTLSMCSRILSKLSVDQPPSPPLPPHLQLSFLSWVSIDPPSPPLPPHLQLSFLSWVLIDPPTNFTFRIFNVRIGNK